MTNIQFPILLKRPFIKPFTMEFGKKNFQIFSFRGLILFNSGHILVI